jgi:two-component system, OmpR family, sensor kinase
VTRLDLRGRVTLATILALGLGLVVLSVAINLLLSSQLSADASTVLRDRGDAQLATLTTTKRGGLHVVEAPRDEPLDTQAWVFADGRTRVRSPARPEVERAAAALATVNRPVERTIGEHVRLLAEPAYARDGRRIGTVVVGLSLLPYEHTEQIALIGTIVLDLFVLMAAALLVRRSVGAALRPVAEMTERAADWSERDLHRRFDMGPPRDELTGLAATLDGLLARIDSVLRHEQRFSAEMAHELRTPLSGVRAEAELALRPGAADGELREALERVLAGTDRMAAVIETLLTTARGDAAGKAGACDPYPPVSKVAESVRQAAAAHGVAIELDGEPGRLSVGADAQVVAQAVHPLLDNAVRHASGAVQVRFRTDGGQVVVAVVDDGPGVAGADVERIFQPGATSGGGAGLGLPLARRLARACGGDVCGVPHAGGGGHFELRLPGSAVRRSGTIQVV